MRRNVVDIDVVTVSDYDAAPAEVVGVQEAVLHRLILAYVSVRPDYLKTWWVGD